MWTRGSSLWTFRFAQRVIWGIQSNVVVVSSFQRLKFAKDESGDPEAPIQNERAYYERVMEIVGQAIRANQTSPELHIKQLLLMEQRGDSKQQLKHEWDRVRANFLRRGLAYFGFGIGWAIRQSIQSPGTQNSRSGPKSRHRNPDNPKCRRTKSRRQ